MRSLKALALMFAVNLLFVVTLSAALAIFHVRMHLVGFALLFGFGGRSCPSFCRSGWSSACSTWLRFTRAMLA